MAAAAVRALVADGRVLVGAGTIVRPDQADLALDAGAQFIVSPGFGSQVVERGRAVGLPVLPGVATVTRREPSKAFSTGPPPTIVTIPAGTRSAEDVPTRTSISPASTTYQVRVVEAELCDRDLEPDGLRCSGIHGDANEALQLEHGSRHARMQIAHVDLDHLLAGDAARCSRSTPTR